MTGQYLVGEVSVLLAELQATATAERDVRALGSLRHQAETGPPATLGTVVVRALQVGDRLCWDSLSKGEGRAFVRQAVIGAELWEFGLCADLV